MLRIIDRIEEYKVGSESEQEFHQFTKNHADLLKCKTQEYQQCIYKFCAVSESETNSGSVKEAMCCLIIQRRFIAFDFRD